MEGKNPLTQIATTNIKKAYYHKTRQGSTAYVTDKDGQVLAFTEYDAWGKMETQKPSTMNFAGLDDITDYTGHAYDEVLEKYFAQAMFYDAVNRRFITEDPVKDGLNWYAYCANNPLNSIDSTGLYTVKSNHSQGIQSNYNSNIHGPSNNPSGNIWINGKSYFSSVSCTTSQTDSNKKSVTREQLLCAGFAESALNDDMIKELNRMLEKYSIDTPDRLRHFFAQVLFESAKGTKTFENGSERYFEQFKYGSKYRGVGYIQVTWDYAYKAFATYLALEKHTDLNSFAKHKNPARNDAATIDKEYTKLKEGSKKLNIDISEFINIVDKGYSYVSQNFAWEISGYYWNINNLNTIADTAKDNVDNVSIVVNKYAKDTFKSREDFYIDMLKNGCFN